MLADLFLSCVTFSFSSVNPLFSMEIHLLQPQNHLFLPSTFMNTFSFSSKFIKRRTASTSRLTSFTIRVLCASSLDFNNTQNELIEVPADRKDGLRNTRVTGARAKFTDAELKENWLSSLTCPFPGEVHGLRANQELPRCNVGSKLVIGVDPDVSGALAVLKIDNLGCTAQVFDSPSLPVLVGKRVRRRLDAKSIVQLIRSFDAPLGTSAYIEQSIPYPQDGKQGWWSGGFGYGLWIGLLVASGFCVTPLPSLLWKNEFELSGSRTSKDDSRKLASELFPSLSPMMKRKKDHGRAEALLIAAYGNGHRIKGTESRTQLEPIS